MPEDPTIDLDLGATVRGLTAGRTVCAHYRLEKILGRGGMGIVWVARDEKLSRDVVVKFAGVWDDSILRAVTNEVVSKPTKVKWDPESFTLRFSEDGKSGSYECSADGKYYTVRLLPP